MDQARNKPYHHGNLAAALVVAAARLIEESGAATLSLREVARLAGVSATAVYRHFTDKEALLAAVAARGFATLVERFEQATSGKPPRDALTAQGLAYIAFAQDHPHLHSLMFGPRVPGSEADAELSHWAERSFRLLADVTGACLGPATPPEKVMSTAVALWSLVHGYAVLRRDGQLADIPAELLPDPAQVMASLVPPL
ncbi:MAG TPA: TetR/AcrR family transcriptional regulator [Magnetospirillum sp.]|nr:TetR/AcrR family transcriptional regulator [Magnetospirillum sp.]